MGVGSLPLYDGKLGGKVVELGRFDIQPLIAGDNAVHLLVFGQPGLGSLHVVTQRLALFPEPEGVLFGRLDLQLDVGIDVGLREGIGNRFGESRIRRTVADADYAALA